MTKKSVSTSRDTKKIVKSPKVMDADARLRKKPRYRSFKLHKKVRHHAGPLPSSWQISKKALSLLRLNARQISMFFLIFGLLYLFFVRGFSAPVNVQDVRDSFDQFSNEEVSSVVANVTVFSLLIESTTSAAGDVQALYQLFFVVISVLALIWLYRQQQAGNKVSMKEAFYKGMFPLIPFSLVLIVIGLQTIPASIGNYLFVTVIESGLAINAFEQLLWLLLFLLLLLLTLYLISSSIIALFVVTLPNMTPMKALKKTKELVTFRRFSIMRKIAGLIIFIMLLYIFTVFPLIFVSAELAQLVFYSLTILVVPFVTAYMFVLYRELL